MTGRRIRKRLGAIFLGSLVSWLVIGILTTGASEPLVPSPVIASDLTVRLDLAGQIPTHSNPTSPAVVGSHLLLIDQEEGTIYLWDGASSHALLTPISVPSELSLFTVEAVLNVAGDAAGTTVYVVFTSTTVPDGITKKISPQFTDCWQVLYQYSFDGTALSNPWPIIAFQRRSDGHSGGGLVVLNDGSVLFATGDNDDLGRGGPSYPQDASNHLGKILRIDPTNGSAEVVALGVRNVQRLVLDPNGGDPRINFVDIGGSVAEELNSIRLADLLDSGAPHNFGWGRNAFDNKAREGTFYIDLDGVAVGAAPVPESGFLQPVAQFGRESQALVAVSGPVSGGQSFSRITWLFGDLPNGSVRAITSAISTSGQSVFRVNLVDSDLQPIMLNALTGGSRSDPRFFNFPDGSAGVLLEKTGNFYHLTELAGSGQLVKRRGQLISQ